MPKRTSQPGARLTTPWILLTALVFATSSMLDPAAAQAPPASLNGLALAWAQGNYGTPVVCEFDGQPVRGIRRIHIVPAPRHVHPPANLVRFVDLEAEGASRCTTDLGAAQPNILGELQIRLPGSYSARDTASREFKDAMRRNQGFEFVVPSGRLRLLPVGADGSEARELDFKGGAAKLHLAARGDDAARVLKEFPAQRLVTLELVTSDGESLRFPLFLSGPPP